MFLQEGQLIGKDFSGCGVYSLQDGLDLGDLDAMTSDLEIYTKLEINPNPNSKTIIILSLSTTNCCVKVPSGAASSDT